MSNVNPYDYPDLWNSFVMLLPSGKFIMPGDVRVSVSGRLKEDRVDVYGQEGVSVTKLNYDFHDVTVKVSLLESWEFDAFDTVIKAFKSDAKTPQQFECLHPQLEIHGVSRLYINDIQTPEFDIEDEYVVTIKMSEWVPTLAGKPVSKPKSSGTEALGNNQPTLESFDNAFFPPVAPSVNYEFLAPSESDE